MSRGIRGRSAATDCRAAGSRRDRKLQPGLGRSPLIDDAVDQYPGRSSAASRNARSLNFNVELPAFTTRMFMM
jgi:hypothetical protein